MPTTEEKVYYKIGEVSQKLGVASHTIRYWENEFSFLKPLRDNRGHRLYTAQDLARLKEMKTLLYQDGYRISGAKRLFRHPKPPRKAAVLPDNLAKELKKIERLLVKARAL